MHPLFQKIIDIFLPPRCLKCGKILGDTNGLCPECFNQINFITRPYCQRCGLPLPEHGHKKDMLCGHCAADSKSPFRMNRAAVCMMNIPNR